MNILGIVVEYNPFHYGHLYHLQESVKKTEADLTIAVMSGSFLQRGEPALVDKWARTKMALAAGVDLVVELPYIFSTQKAEIFSDGAVSILHHLGVTHLCFGSESGEIDSFTRTVHRVTEREKELDKQVQVEIKKGTSYPTAFSEAYHKIFHQENVIDLGRPNNILGYHYVKAITKLNSPMKPYTIKREKAEYHEKVLTEERIASATAIRQQLIEDGKTLEELITYLPPATFKQLSGYQSSTGTLHHWEHYYPLLQHRLLTSSAEQIRNIYECEEGLEYRLLKFISNHSTFEGFVSDLKTKRYTWTRLQRLLVHVLLNTTKSFMRDHCHPLTPPYIRVLGMTSIGRAYLSEQKKKITIPLVTRASEYDHPVLQKDTLAAQIHRLPLRNSLPVDEYKAFPVQYRIEEGVQHG